MPPTLIDIWNYYQNQFQQTLHYEISSILEGKECKSDNNSLHTKKRLNSTVWSVYQAGSRGWFQPRIKSHISHTKTIILIIKTPSTSNSNNNYAKFTKKNLNHHFLRKIYQGLLFLVFSPPPWEWMYSCTASECTADVGKQFTNRVWHVVSGSIESRDKYRHLGIFKN